MTHTATLVLDPSPLLAALNQASPALPALADLPEGIRESLLEIVQSGFGRADAVEKIVRLDIDPGAATGAGEVVVRLYPGDGLLGLLAAFRAGNRDALVVEHTGFGHNETPEGD